MFNRFFKNKDDHKGGPPGHRQNNPGGAAAGGGPAQPPEEPIGGGFFNLPPPVAKPYAGAAASSYNPTTTGMGAAPAPQASSYSHQPPSYAPSYGHEPPAAVTHAPSLGSGGSGASLDMFGGMAIKQPAAAAPAPHHSINSYSTPPPATVHSTSYSAPPAAAPASLFSGLDLAPSVPSYEDPGHMQAPQPLARKTSDRRAAPSGSYNYLDVAAAADPADGTPKTRTSSGTSSLGTSRQGSKVVKKKKKTFRPGFGRQLSDDSVAALQRGDLREDDVIQMVDGAPETDHSRTSSVSRIPTAPTDLAHLLPPVVAGSVLAGLTVHRSGSGSGSTLAGLTVHHGKASSSSSSSSPRAMTPSKVKKTKSQAAASSNGSVLAGLTVHSKTPKESQAPEPKPVVESTPVQPPAPPAPVLPPTPEERLLNTLRDFHASAVSFREIMIKQNEDENQLLERKSQLNMQLTQYELDLRTVEAQQHHACEVEDFEKADALNGTINSIRHCITLTESDVRKIDSELVAFVKAKEKAFGNQLRSTRGTLRELEKFRDDQKAERTAVRSEWKQYESEETEQLQLEAERIDSEMHHVSVNLDHLVAEKTEIESTVEDQCRPEFVTQAQLREERAVVQQEVEELERLLKAKMDRVREIDASIDKAEKDIDVVRSRYSRQLKRIADRESGILKTKMEVESDVEQLKNQRGQFKTKLQDYESTYVTIGDRISVVRKEMRAAVLLAGVLEVQETRREQSIIRKKLQTAELSSLCDAAAIAEQSFTMLRKQHDELEKSLAIHQNAIASAESMIPALEQEKKLAATQRNFKDAARISKDIKALEKDRATAEEMVEVVDMELQDLKERIEKREVEFNEKKEEQKKMEKQLELVTLQELWKEAKHLRKSIRKIEKYKSDGIAADDGIDFRSSAMLLVQAEYDACMVQVEALEKKYDVSDPAKDEPESDDDDDEAEDFVMDDDEDDMSENGTLRSSGVGGSNATPRGGVADANEGEDGEVDGALALEDIASKLSELEAKIDQATENEEYELAARLDEKIEALKRRQQAIVQQSSKDNAGEEQQEEEEEEQEQISSSPEQTPVAESSYQPAAETPVPSAVPVHSGESQEQLASEWHALQTRIERLEVAIAEATDDEEYERAAAFDDQLHELLEEQDEITQLLGGAPPAEDYSSSSRTVSSSGLFSGLGIQQPLPQESGPSMFGNLTMSSVAPTAASSYASISDPDADSSFFGGLQLNAAVMPAEATTSAVEQDTGSSFFGGLQLSAAAVPTEEVVETTTSVVEQETEESMETAVEDTGASFFGGLQLNTSASEAVEVESTEQHQETTTVEESGASFFGGLQLNTTTTTETVETVETVESFQTQQTTALFNGLAVGASDSVLSQDAVHEDEHETEDAEEEEYVDAAHDQEHQEEEPTVTVVAPVEAASAASSGSIFGGLSFATSSLADSTEHAEELTDKPMHIVELATEEEETPAAAPATAPPTDLFGGLSMSAES